MTIKNIIANRSEVDIEDLNIDTLELEWWELNKRIYRKRTSSGLEIACKFTAEKVSLKDGDILYKDSQMAIVVSVLPTEVIVLSPQSMVEMATACYEIGNKHTPLYIDGEELLLPYEAPMFKWLETAGFNPAKQSRRLESRLRSNAAEHHHHHGGEGNILKKVIDFATHTH